MVGRLSFRQTFCISYHLFVHSSICWTNVHLLDIPNRNVGLLSVQQEGWLHPILWGGDLIHRGRLGGPTKSRRTRMSPSAFVGTKFECIAHIAPERKNLNYSSCFVIKLLPQALSLTLKAAWCCATLKDLRFLRA